MFDQELRKEFQSILRDGFDAEFIEWCVNEFDSHEFTDDQLPSARLYLPYLRHTMEFLSSEDPVIRSRIESLCAALQSDDECTTEISRNWQSIWKGRQALTETSRQELFR